VPPCDVMRHVTHVRYSDLNPESQRAKTRERTCGTKLLGVNFSCHAHVCACVMAPFDLLFCPPLVNWATEPEAEYTVYGFQ
jgi:hypothetical protein